jgi:hypothetical protein
MVAEIDHELNVHVILARLARGSFRESERASDLNGSDPIGLNRARGLTLVRRGSGAMGEASCRGEL